MIRPTTFKSIPVRVAMTPETKCGYCTNSKCCTYITQQIDTPRSMLDFDQLLWQVSHHNVQAYKDEDGWFLLVNNTCSHLQSGGRCGIYEVRPKVCRTYDNDYCEYDESAEANFELFFENYASLLNYCKERFKGWDRRLTPRS